MRRDSYRGLDGLVSYHGRSEERRVGKECNRRCRSCLLIVWWRFLWLSLYHRAPRQIPLLLFLGSRTTRGWFRQRLRHVSLLLSFLPAVTRRCRCISVQRWHG